MFRYSQSKYPDFKKLYWSAADLISDIPMIRRRRRMRIFFQALKYFSLTSIIFFMFAAFLAGGKISAFLTAHGNLWSDRKEVGPGDYLSVEFSYEPDASYINRNIDYRVVRSGDGLVAILKINYADHRPSGVNAGAYHTIARIYVPEGSQLISSKGGDGDISKSNASGRHYYETYFTAEPGKIINLEFVYVLPSELLTGQKYQLYVKKQPGGDIGQLTVDLDPGNGVKSYSPTGFYASRTPEGGVRWETDLNSDRYFTIDY